MRKRLAKQDYDIVTPNNEKIYTEPGKNGPEDMKIFTRFPKIPWAHSLYYIGVCLRLKGLVEDRNYPRPKFKGRNILVEFCNECITRLDKSIKQICKDFNIPTREDK